MLDNLPNQASFQEEKELLDPNTPKPRRNFDQMTGMTAPQRFALAVMFLILVSLLGTMFLLISGRIVPAFMF